MPATTVLATLLFLQPATTGFSEDPAQVSTWMQQACRIQQVNGQGGGEASYTDFCACLDGEIADHTSTAGYRAFALGAQGRIDDQALVEDWEAAAAESSRIFESLDAAEQTGAMMVIQDGFDVCFSLVPSQP